VEAGIGFPQLARVEIADIGANVSGITAETSFRLPS
jgi:hypothetical protein